MALRIKISAQAAKEVRKAVEWWAANRPAAPGAVGSDFGACVALLADQPSLAPYMKVVESKGFVGFFSDESSTLCITGWSTASCMFSDFGMPAGETNLIFELCGQRVNRADSLRS